MGIAALEIWRAITNWLQMFVCVTSDHEAVPLGCKQTDSCIQLTELEAEYGPVMKKGSISDPTDAALAST